MIVLPPALFETPLPGLDRPLTKDEGAVTRKYLEILMKWQRVHRLVGSTRLEWLVDNVLLDSLAFLGSMPSQVEKLADVGSGAGIPGVPLAIARPDAAISLIEARQRRASFLSTVVRELNLLRASVVAYRAEDLGDEYAGAFDVVVMRCAGEGSSMLPAAMRLVRRKGMVVVAAGPGRRPASAEEIVVPMGKGRGRVFHRYIRE